MTRWMRLFAACFCLQLAVVEPFGSASAQERADVEAEPLPDAPRPTYDLLYDVRLAPSERAAHVRMRVKSETPRVKSVRLRIDPNRHYDFRGDGEIEKLDGAILWRPPPTGGSLRWGFRIDHLRDAASYDARCAEKWALFRGGDLVPAARVVTEDLAHSNARLRLRLPEGWTAVLPYERAADGRYQIEHEHRRFDRPTGWWVLGHLGVLRERIAGTSVAVAGPVQQGLRRHDILALLRWTLPALRDAVGSLPERLLVVGAGDPMWRGGLSGPRSVFVHADRPLMTHDLTSPVLHELMHTVLGIRSGPGGDWIVEGLAELYSLELLVRSKTVSRRRYRKALQRLAREGADVPILDVQRASGDVTARAVTVLHALDQELERGSDEELGLDEVLVRIAAKRAPLTTVRFRELVEEVAGRSLRGWFREQVPVKGEY
ncbi:MAG: hypothetical protein OEP95_00045 [Myxococcales bacterium]|nr:hypothetical protein [Myxococcales bacterium]